MAELLRRLFFCVVAASLPAAPVLAAPDATGAPAPRGDDVVWHWYSDCPAPVTIKVEVVQRGATVFASTFPMCHLRRDGLATENFQRKITFPLSDERLRLFGQSPKTELIGEIREVEKQTGGLMLGLSFLAADKSVYDGSVLADPTNAVELKPAAGVVVRFSPMSR